jgi:hypothetical protein
VDDVELDFKEILPDLAEAKRRATTARGERIRAGLAARKARGETRRSPGEGSLTLSLTEQDKQQRRQYAHAIRAKARSCGYTEAELVRATGATPAEITAILRGDLSRLPLPRMQGFAAAVARMA